MSRDITNSSGSQADSDISQIQSNTATTNSLLTSNNSLTTTSNTRLTNILSALKPVYDAVGLKTPNSDGSRGIISDGRNYYALENLGNTKNVFLNQYKTIVPLLGANQFIKLPTSATTLKVSSDSNADVGQQLFILGYNASFQQTFDVFVLNGQTPVTGVYGNAMFRILGGQIISSSNANPGTVTSGNLYVVQSSYNTFTAGVPASLAECCATAFAGTGNIYTGVITIPPQADLYASELVISSNASGNSSDIDVTFFSRMGTGSGWRALATLNVNSTLPSISLRQGGFPSLNTDGSGTLFHDLMLCVQRTSGNSNNISVSTYLTCIQVVPV